MTSTVPVEQFKVGLGGSKTLFSAQVRFCLAPELKLVSLEPSLQE